MAVASESSLRSAASIASVVSSRCWWRSRAALSTSRSAGIYRAPGSQRLRRVNHQMARLPGDNRSIGRIGIGIMHRAVAEFMVTEPAAAGNDDLELVGLVEVRPGDGARPLLDQEGHRVQSIVGRRL